MFGKCSELEGGGGLPRLSPGWWFLQQCSENVRNCWVPRPLDGSPPPLQIFGNVRKCSENVRNWRGRSPNLPPVGGATRKCLEHVRNMFGNGGFPPSSRWWFLLKCSEIVREMFGTGVAGPGGGLVERPGPFRTFSEHFRTFPNISEDLRGELPPRWSRHPPIPNLSEPFPNLFGWHRLPG